ncbi:protein containing ATP-grasp fold, RimK-type domain [Sulfurimonas gotlandica GD1]|uniref:Protein containing ATP-grasp fold, RimK-type domain n=1 Tax=Sulfurimonas gotlandica (strain DSM 19862 / JCM 16533 / GD1) TaxID=929558 RepID=B6BL95_SULGG|nr:helix-hairpin-helix domain-containing protein [Sulfurimonas gotlandica]EDZ62018.1 RimK domain protein ATP-grasp [Sulfurimonas gotlandica GD1]EHP28548.1 protein containing ATP-grasp fold, RimK-type domain [Sulfurimonas gotlandica GD1]
MGLSNKQLPKLGFLYLDYVLRFFDHSNFKGWPNKIETVTYHWKNDKDRFIKEVKRKKIDVLIGNIPATAYETFREIARELPHVRFIPSMDTQFSNKSKENVTRFAWKYDLPIPKTYIYYKHDNADKFLKKCKYPKIIKKSYGPSNYGGYFVHKVDSYKEARELFDEKKYHPQYFQDFIPMEADIRVMLIGHKPVCAFWRRAPEGEWLTNTSQGGSMDYNDVPKNVLDLAVQVSKAANAEYWACDVAYGKDGKVRILECATAFAAFPYIRDWIGQYIMWSLSEGRFRKPHAPMFNWEELGKLDSSILRTMRHITFGEYNSSYDGAYFGKKKKLFGENEVYLHVLDSEYKMYDVKRRWTEEWPSEIYNYQDNLALKPANKSSKQEIANDKDVPSPTKDESSESVQDEAKITKEELSDFLTSVDGVGAKKVEKIVKHFGNVDEVVGVLHQNTSILTEVKGITKKLASKIEKAWKKLLK